MGQEYLPDTNTVSPKATDEQLIVLNNFISSSVVFDLNENVILKSVEIRKKYRLKFPNAIIAATAEVNGLILLTRNISDFEKVTTLKSINPFYL